MSKHRVNLKKQEAETGSRKLSVFERLGNKVLCEHWLQYNSCPLGSSCRYADTHIVSIQDQKYKLDSKSKSQMSKKHNKVELKKSKCHHSPEPDWEQWGLGDLEGADEKALERRRQELKRALQMQLSKEKEVKKKDKPVQRKRSQSSSSTTSTSSETSSSTSSSGSSTEPGHKTKKTRHNSTSSDKSSPRLAKKKTLSLTGKTIDKKSKHLSEHKMKNTAGTSGKKVSNKTNLKQQQQPHWNVSQTYHKEKMKSPPRKYKNDSPKQKTKDAVRDRHRPSPIKSNKESPSRNRKRDAFVDRKKHFGKDRKHSPHNDRSRDNRDTKRRARSNEDDKGGLKKGGKILPLKPSLYSKEVNKTRIRSKTPVKRHEHDRKTQKVRYNSRDKNRDNDRPRERKTPDREKRGIATSRNRDADRSREQERERIFKEREAERQKEREEALERCRERQRERERERERLEKERREEEEKKRQRSERERELPSLLSLKSDHPHSDDNNSRSRSSTDKRSSQVNHSRDQGRRRTDDVTDTDYQDDRRQMTRVYKREEVSQDLNTSDHHREWVPRYDQQQKWRDRDEGATCWNYQDNRRQNPVELQWNPAQEKTQLLVTHVTADHEPVANTTHNLDEVLSDISDDVNEILNQDDDVEGNTSTNYDDFINVDSNQLQKQPQSTEFFLEPRRQLLDCLAERSLDFEEISDEELEEEARLNKGMVDVLGADWAELVEQARPKPQLPTVASCARRHWQIQSIIQRIGVSMKYAGTGFVNNLITKYKSDVSKVQTTSEQPANEFNEEIQLKHAVSRLHVALYKHEQLEDSLFASNLLKPAISTRTDLALRRELCNLSSKEPLHMTNTTDVKLYETSVKLFQA